jgi:hypothetical protein
MLSLCIPTTSTGQQVTDTIFQIRDLERGTPIERAITTADTHYYRIKLKAGEFLRALVDQRGIDLIIIVYTPDGQKILEVDSPNGNQGPEPIAVKAETSGSYRIEVRALEKNVPPGRYEVRIEEILTAEQYAARLPAIVAQQVVDTAFHPHIGKGLMGTILEEKAAPGNNYDKAEFSLWYPNDAGYLRAVVVLVPGSNDDGRSMVEDSVWQVFATRHSLALMGCRFTDKTHDQSFIEHYADASHGSGQALLDVLVAFGGRSQHPELASAPFLLWGWSAGGEFNYEFVAWKPERVVAFIVNKGGIYYTALAPQSARNVPGILFIGGKDIESRTNTIVGLFAVNRRAGALWALAEEPGVAHGIGRSRGMAAIFFEDVLTLRLGGPSSNPNDPSALRSVLEKTGFVGDLKAKTFQAVSDAVAPNYSKAWLPTMRVARAWQALVTEKPFDR